MGGPLVHRSFANPAATAPRRGRWTLAAACLAVVTLGLASRRYPGRLFPAVLEKYPGDALWALMAFLGLAWLAPRAPTRRLVLAALGGSFFVEFAQLYHAPWLDAIRRTTLGHLALGSAFSAVDLAAYAVGVGVGIALDRAGLFGCRPRRAVSRPDAAEGACGAARAVE